MLNAAFLRARMMMGDSFRASFSTPGVIWNGGRVGPWLSMEFQVLQNAGFGRVGNWFVRR